MGCDIHAFVEYKSYNRDYWRSWGRAFHLPRCYSTFAALAGVRNYNETEVKIPPRGMPADIAYSASDEFWKYVSEDGSDESISRERAERWVAERDSVWRDEKKSFVSDPDSHSHSWLTLNEFKEIVQTAGREYRALAAAMEILARDGEARIVFWFDN